MNPSGLSRIRAISASTCLSPRPWYPMPQSAAPERSDKNATPPFLLLWRYARKHWRLVAAVAVAVTLAVTFFSFGQKKIFRATATLQIDPTPTRPLGNDVGSVDLGVSSFWNNKEYYETQYKIIQSRHTAESAVRALGLDHDSGFLLDLPPGQSGSVDPVTVSVAAETLQGRITVEPMKDSRLVVVSYEDANPARATRIVNALADNYVQNNIDDAMTSSATATDWLKAQLGKLKDELEKNEMALHDYKKEHQILSVSIDDQSNMVRGEMQQLSDALTRVRTSEEQVASRKAQLDKIDANNPTDIPASELLDNAVLQQLREQYVGAEADREGLVASGLGTNHPDVKAADAKLETSRRALGAEIRNVQGSVSRDLNALRREASGLSRLFEEAKKRGLDLNLLEIQYNRLRRNKENTEKLYSLVLERAGEGDLTRMMRFNNISVVDPALVPDKPVRPRVPLNIAFGAVFGVALGVGVAVGREFVDRSVKTPGDIEQDLGVSFVGLLPELAEGQQGASPYSNRRRARQEPDDGPPELIVHRLPASGIAEAARAIRTNIMFMSPDRPYRRMLVTSAGPAEGKTTVACCVAVAMAQAGQRVILVDCDLRRPRLHRIFGRSNDVGVSSAVLRPAVLDECPLETTVDNLSLLPSGPHVPNPAELVHSASFGALLDELSKRYDRVILDSPPVVPVTDAAILATQVDGALLVVRAFRTSRELARQAVRTLSDVGARPFGIVLNAVDLGKSEYGYYHYYYYKRDGYAPQAGPPDGE